jgi:hypothetical protein
VKLVASGQFRTHALQKKLGEAQRQHSCCFHRHHFSPVTILAQLASDDVLDGAYE